MPAIPIVVEIDPGLRAALAADGAKDLIEDLRNTLGDTALIREVRRRGGSSRGSGSSYACSIQLPDLIQVSTVASSATVLAVLYKFMSKIIDRHKSRSVTLQMDGKKFSIKGHSDRQEQALLRWFSKLQEGGPASNAQPTRPRKPKKT